MKNRMKLWRYLGTFLLMMFLVVGCLSRAVDVKAVNMDYEGEITPDMIKEEQNKNDSNSENNVSHKNRINVGNNIQFDTDLQCYVYPASVGEIYCGAMDGMMLQEGVSFSVSEGVNYLIMKDGEKYTFNTEKIYDKGRYTVSVTNNGNNTKIFSFTIVGKEIGANVTGYDLPNTFVLSKLTLNGNDILTDTRRVDFSEEGNYVIEYGSSRNKKKYQLQLTVDHEAPTLALKGVVDGKIRGPLDISDYQSTDKITITRNNREIKYRPTLTDSGKYVITISDEAGNTNVYTVFIGFYLNVQSISFGILFVLIIVGMFVYIRISRKRFRVR